MDAERRIEDVEARLAAVEARLKRVEVQDAPASVPAPSRAGELWALEELRRRAGDHDGAVLFTGTVPLPGGARSEWQWGVPAESLLGTDWNDAVAPLAALAHRVRLGLLHEVLAGTSGAAELQERVELGATGQLYHHLRQLLSAGWLRQTTRGHYAIPAERVVPLLVILAAARG